MGDFNRRRCLGFSFIEVVMAMTILAMLVGISVVTYTEGVEESKRDTALQQLHYVSNAIQRWEMVKNSRYLYSSLRPLEGEFLKNIEADPWGREYKINIEQGIVFSLGPDGADEDGSGLSVSFDTDRDVAPAAPSNFTVHRVNDDINFAWEEPVLNIDGSPIDGDLAKYSLYYRTSAQATWTLTAPGGLVINAGQESATVEWTDVVTEGDTVYFNLKAVDTNNNEGPPSPPAGIFVVQDTAPVINMLSASPPRCPLQTPFNVRIDVSDGDANLDYVSITGTGISKTWSAGGELTNLFHPVISYTYIPTTTCPEFDLIVEARDVENNVATKTFGTPIAFTNKAPRINTLSPGNYNITVDPNAQMSETSNMVEVTYLIEASDGESNLTELKLEAAYDTDGTLGADETLTKVWTYGSEGVSLAVESHVWSVLPKEDQVIDIEVTATDKVGAVSTIKKGTLRFSTDGTPPQHLTYWLDKSNPSLEHEEFLRWWIRDRSVDEPAITSPDYFEADCWSWENESPPVTYYMAISTTSTVSMSNFEANAITASRTNPGGSPWVEQSSAGATKFILTPNDGLKENYEFDSTAIYYTLLKARNSVGLESATSATPMHHSSKVSQNAFGYDAIGPEISEITIDSLGPVSGTSDVWFDGVLNVFWTTEDYVIAGDAGSGIGSGPAFWEYFIIREQSIDNPIQDRYEPVEMDTYVKVRSPEFRQMEVESFPPYETARYIINIRAGDVAGNLSPFYSAGARLDMTEPTTGTSGTMPLIANAVGGYIYAANTILASWYNVFHDNESGIESFDWGVATTDALDGAIPDIVPWQRVEGFLMNGTYVQNDPPLLTNSIDVFVCLRARNYAGRVSGVAYSEPARVDVDMYTKLSATPRVGHETLSVEFTAAVSGGQADYEYTFLFDGTYGDSSRRCIISSDYTEITTSFTYDLATFGAGRHSARVIIRDDYGTGTVSIQDIYFELYPSPYVAAVYSLSTVDVNRMHFYRSESMNTGHVFNWTAAGGATCIPVGLEMGPSDRFAIIPFDNLGSTDPGYTRLPFVGDLSPIGFQALDFNPLAYGSILFTPDRLSGYAVSPDGSYASFAGSGTSLGSGLGWIARVLLNPSDGKVFGNPNTDWGAYSAEDGKTITVNSLAVWNGGLNGAIAVQDSNLPTPNVRHGVSPLELGLIGQLDATWETHFGTQAAVDDFKGIHHMTVSPDNNWIAMTTNIGTSDEIYVGETRELSAGTGSRIVTSIPGTGTYTNAEWMPDSSRFIVAKLTTGQLYSCSITGYPTPLALDPIITTNAGVVTAAPSRAVHIDLTDDGEQILLCGKTGLENRIWRGKFTGTNNVQWLDWTPDTDPLVAARFVKPYDYGSPRIETGGSQGAYAHPQWDVFFSGANLWPATEVKIVREPDVTPIVILDWTAVSAMTGTPTPLPGSATATYNDLKFSFDTLSDGTHAGKPYQFEFRNSVGVSVRTTSITMNRP